MASANDRQPVSPGLPARGRPPRADRLAAIDLGSNNCRLLTAEPYHRSFRIVDSFSRIVRLGEGVGQTGRLSEAAMTRTIAALRICADKMARKHVVQAEAVATQACRAAANGAEFLDRVRSETGIAFRVIDAEEEARLAVAGCVGLLDPGYEMGLVVDIGGGSTELSWVDLRQGVPPQGRLPPILGWGSAPVGVVNLAERHPREGDRAWYERMRADAAALIAGLPEPAGARAPFAAGRGLMVGTSGTVTSIAGVFLGLERFRRDAVDGMWLAASEAREVAGALAAMSLVDRARQPCIGPDRADLVVAGCAILEAVLDCWPAHDIRVADRGLREGLILTMLAQTGRRGRGSS